MLCLGLGTAAHAARPDYESGEHRAQLAGETLIGQRPPSIKLKMVD